MNTSLISHVTNIKFVPDSISCLQKNLTGKETGMYLNSLVDVDEVTTMRSCKVPRLTIDKLSLLTTQE